MSHLFICMMLCVVAYIMYQALKAEPPSRVEEGSVGMEADKRKDLLAALRKKREEQDKTTPGNSGVSRDTTTNSN